MRTWTLISYEWKTYLADKKALGVMLLAPLFLLILCGYALSPLLKQESILETFDIALVNLDPSWETKTIINHFESSTELRKLVNLQHVTRAEGQKRLLANQVAAMVIIPANFSKDLEVGINTPVEVIGNPQRPMQAEVVHILMQSGADLITAAQSGVNTIYIYLRNAQVSAAELEQVFNQSVLKFTLQSLARGELFTSQSITAFEGLTAREYYAVSLSILFLLGTGLLAARSNLNEHKLLGQRLLGAGLPMTNMVVARWLSLASLLAIPYTLYYSLILLFMPGFLRGQVSLFILVSVLIIGTISALYLCLATMVRELANLNLLGFLLIIVMSLVGGTLIPLAYLPNWVEQITFLSLNKWAAQGLFAALFDSSGQLLGQSMLVLGLFTVLLLTTSIWLGKRRLG